MTLALKTRLTDIDFDTAITRVTDALKAEGFGVLTEIDITGTFKQKLDVDYRPYRILGACNPALAHRALEATAEAGLLLPCNVTVSQAVDGEIDVAIVDPMTLLDVADPDTLRPVGEEAAERLARVIASLST